jgi:DNA segregation ATPase FtsK/SpoIIIE, S-DNA-T family
MPGPPLFQRSPRLLPELPGGEVEISGPPPAPAEPAMSLLSVAWSLLPGLLSAAVMYLFSRSSGGTGWNYIAYSLPMMAAGYLVQVGHLYGQKRKYHRDVESRENKYRARIESHRQVLQRLREQQQGALRELDPDAGACTDRAGRLDPRLWERSPGDADFLSVRLGLGALPFMVAVKVPRAGDQLDPDPLQQSAAALAEEFAAVPGVPVRAPLREAGVTGLVGPRAVVLHAARQMVMQLAAHHSPDEVKLAVIFPAGEAAEWAWMRWLPHVWLDGRRRRLMAADRDGAHEVLGELQEMLGRRKQQAAAGAAVAGQGLAPGVAPHIVVVIADPALAGQEMILPLLLRDAGAVSSATIFLAERKEDLPKECRAITELTAHGEGQLILTGPPSTQVAFVPEEVPVDLAEGMARAMAAIGLQRMSVSAEIPRRVELLALLGCQNVDELDLISRWQAAEPFRSLAAPVGAGAGGEPLLLDLHERGQGPHGLVAGATGSGKSELLQTLVASLAVSFHPHEVTFLMVDYKGGGMANAFRGLPHLVGTITNLEGSLSRRALAALKAELKRRQRVLGEARVSHIDEYLRARRQGRAGLQPLPHLIVMVDEFAELKAEQPEFMRELISAVRVGRSLGVHLILATQKPAGVVDEQIWSNTRFRLCLRVERPEDSQEVIRCPLAAEIAGAGRAYFQVGHNERLELFQAGWGGAPYRPEARPDDDMIAEVALEGTRYPLVRSEASGVEADGPSQLQALVARITKAAAAAGIEPLPGPWVPPLPFAVDLAQVCGAAGGSGWNGSGWTPAPWLEPVIGLYDDPENQRQAPLRLPLGREGHLAVYGAPGSGKTTFLEMLAASLALDHSPADLHIYLVDGAGRGLAGPGAFPHVGAVVAAGDTERLQRLVRYLHLELDRRKERLALGGVSSAATYRQKGAGPMPAVVLMVDNYPTLAAAYDEVEEAIARLAREGGACDIHLVLTAGSPALVRHKVASNITGAVALNLADRSEYPVAVGRTGGLEPQAGPGRGLAKGEAPVEFQTALADAQGIAVEMARVWGAGPRPEPVRTLPEVVGLSDVSQAVCEGLAVPVGLEAETLEPFLADLADGPHFLVAGPAASGKTTLLQTWLLSLMTRHSPSRVEVWLAEPGPGGLSPLAGLPHVRAHATDEEALTALVGSVEQSLQERRLWLESLRRSAGVVDERAVLDRYPALVLAMDDYDLIRDLLAGDAGARLEALVRRERGTGFSLLLAGSSSVLNQCSYEGLVRAIKGGQTGFLLGSTDHSDLQLLNISLPSGEAGRLLPPGQGYFARRGRGRAIKAATPHEGGDRLMRLVERIARKEGGNDAHSGTPERSAVS